MPKELSAKQNMAAPIFEMAVAVPTVAFLATAASRQPGLLSWDLVLWGLVVAVVELLPVPAWRGLRISVGFPVLVAVAFIYAPAAAGIVAFLASSDPREVKREVSIANALFNRSQIALAVMVASWTFHALADMGDPTAQVLAASALAVAADYLVNATLVVVAASLAFSLSPVAVAQKLRIGNPVEFLVSYLGLGVLGIVLAKLYLEVGFWSVAVFVVPLIFARQMFFRSRALEEAHKELADREVVLSRLSDRMAEERQDERNQIASYLHDDLAQSLFRLSLQIDLADRYLVKGDNAATRKVLMEMKETKNETAERIRSVIRDLHRSPLGRAGLAEAIRSFTNEVGVTGPVFDVRVQDLPLAPSIQLLAYQIAREAIMNALKYAEASSVSVTFERKGADVELVVSDDGVGFDAAAGEPEGHYGLTMMKERAQVAGGSLDLVSANGHGTIVTARFPSTWLNPDRKTLSESDQMTRSSGSFGTIPRTEPKLPDSVINPETV